ncbi:hypothetical protein HMPREF0645_1630 [Hallella bergensis DSM 17361]|uniref:Uncharacterized protein n=2 Tax=Hallella bergensis TaxID=242750 RepID=D1PXE5_9BACT|nr:hypothetical protein HMPREF0645_1630 [Hallella bergensis DSM 17361]
MTKVHSRDDEAQNAGRQDSIRDVSNIFLFSRQVFSAKTWRIFFWLLQKQSQENSNSVLQPIPWRVQQLTCDNQTNLIFTTSSYSLSNFVTSVI